MISSSLLFRPPDEPARDEDVRGLNFGFLVPAFGSGFTWALLRSSLCPLSEAGPKWEKNRRAILGEVTVGEAKKMDEHLGKLHQMVEDRELDLVLSIDQQIQDLIDEKKRLEREYGPAIAWAKKMKIWPHFAKGGNTMIPVAFEDADGDFHQIIEGEVE